MHFTTLLPVATALLGLASAAPHTNTTKYASDDLAKRGIPGGVYWCIKSNWQGECRFVVYPYGQCWNINYPWAYHAISSVGPEWGTKCNFFNKNDCKGRSLNDVRYPGFNNLVEQNYNDQIASVQCYPN